MAPASNDHERAVWALLRLYGVLVNIARQTEGAAVVQTAAPASPAPDSTEGRAQSSSRDD